MNIISLVFATYMGLVTLICDVQPLPQPPTFTDGQMALTCLVRLETETTESAWFFKGIIQGTETTKADIRMSDTY